MYNSARDRTRSRPEKNILSTQRYLRFLSINFCRPSNLDRLAVSRCTPFARLQPSDKMVPECATAACAGRQSGVLMSMGQLARRDSRDPDAHAHGWRRARLAALSFLIVFISLMAPGRSADLAPSVVTVDTLMAARSARAFTTPLFQFYDEDMLAYLPFDGTLENALEYLDQAFVQRAGTAHGYNVTVPPVAFRNLTSSEALVAFGGTPDGFSFTNGVLGLSAKLDGSALMDTGVRADAASLPVATFGAWVRPEFESQRLGAVTVLKERKRYVAVDVLPGECVQSWAPFPAKCV